MSAALSSSASASRRASGLMNSRTRPGPATLRHHDAVIGCLREAGFPVAMVAHAFSAIDAYVYGFVLQELSLPFDTAEESAAVADEMAARMPAGAYPHLEEFTAEHVMQPGYDFGAEFGFGLDLLLDGLERAIIAA